MASDPVPADRLTNPAAPAAGARYTWLRRGLRWLALAALLWLAWCGLRVALAARLALHDVQRLRQEAANPTLASLGPVRNDIVALDFHLGEINSAGAPFLWVASHLDWLPVIGPDLQAARPMLNMAQALTDAGHRSLDALAPVTAVLADRGRGDLLARMVPALATVAPALSSIESEFAQAEAWRSEIRDPHDPRLVGLLEKVDKVLPLVRPGIQALRLAPDLLGGNGPRTYLILAQNNDELRATGGFISGVGIVRLDQGRIVDLRLADSYAADNLANPHPAAPRVLAEQMGAQMLLLRDSNWSPDFPTSAQVARSLYEQDQGAATDGAVAIDLEGVRLLVAALGPLTVPGRPVPVTGDNVIAQMKQAWDTPDGGTTEAAKTADWWLKRKDFMGPLMMAALARLQSGDGLPASDLAAALVAMLDGHHLQIAVDDPQMAALLARQHWDGALRPPKSGDFLAVVDSNLGFNKANAAVRSTVDYRVENANGALAPAATLTLTYTHTAPAIREACDRAPRYGASYDEMTDRCYWDYLRVYLPANNSLLAVEGLDGAGAEPGEQDATLISGSFVLRPGETRRVTLRYQLSANAAARPYHLSLRAQAGGKGGPLTIQAGDCRWQSDLSRDRDFECSR